MNYFLLKKKKYTCIFRFQQNPCLLHCHQHSWLLKITGLSAPYIMSKCGNLLFRNKKCRTVLFPLISPAECHPHLPALTLSERKGQGYCLCCLPCFPFATEPQPTHAPQVLCSPILEHSAKLRKKLNSHEKFSPSKAL